MRRSLKIMQSLYGLSLLVLLVQLNHRHSILWLHSLECLYYGYVVWSVYTMVT